jgi:hypothetical protein
MLLVTARLAGIRNLHAISLSTRAHGRSALRPIAVEARPNVRSERTQAAVTDAGLSDQELARADPSSLDATIKKIGDLALVGGMVWSEETLGWVADWRLAAPGRAYRWQIRGGRGTFRA